ncbi:hypothetical protein KAR91_02440 [Candidatus Pacearchaeota archaeon]|nr:hypothetical protein [Candidatus Pacearchaeota archaeon]
MTGSTKLHSEILGCDIKLNHETGNIVVNQKKPFPPEHSDKYVMYEKSEVEIIKKCIGEITPQVHLVKTLFDGVIVEKLKPVSFKAKYQQIPVF